jgi:two-component system, chemotaxis family, chemotaxis protein CheY
MPNIIIVDDEELIRSLLRKSLVRLGYKVIEAENGITALEMINEEKIDLIISDLVMPEKGGIELLMELNNLFPDIKKIAISGKLPTDNQALSDLAERFGVDAVFSKPFEIFDLLKVIKSLVPVSISNNLE